jgi:hypothetical protein
LFLTFVEHSLKISGRGAEDETRAAEIANP